MAAPFENDNREDLPMILAREEYMIDIVTNVLNRVITEFTAAKPPDALTFPDVTTTLGAMYRPELVPVTLPSDALGIFLDAVSPELDAAGVDEAQIWLQDRQGKGAGDPAKLYGIILDLDFPVDDVVDYLQTVGAPLPHGYWPTKKGSKLPYLFDRELTPDEWYAAARWLVCATGADVASARPTQPQRLPLVRRDTKNGVALVEGAYHMLSPQPLDYAALPLDVVPRRIADALGEEPGRITEPERDAVLAWLASIGAAVPTGPGRARGDVCCIGQHDSACVYTYWEEDGQIAMHCYGAHDGLGSQHWIGTDLLFAAIQAQSIYDGTAPAPRSKAKIPLTWAGAEFRKGKFASLPDRNLAEELWLDVELRRLGTRAVERANWIASQRGIPSSDIRIDLTAMQDLPRLRTRPYKGIVIQPCWDTMKHQVALLRPDGSLQPLNLGKGTTTLHPVTHAPVWRATNALDLNLEVVEVKDPGPPKGTKKVLSSSVTTDINGFSPIWNLAMGGNIQALVALGIPEVTPWDFPVAFVTGGWVHDANGLLRLTLLPEDVDPGDFDPVEFFLGLFRRRLLPLRSEQDVIKTVMAAASPLLRGILPGQLGNYLFRGPSGSGKTQTVQTLTGMWGAASAPGNPPAAFALNIHKGDQENGVMFAAAGTAVFALASEAGRRKGMTDNLVRFVSAPAITARPLYGHPYEIPNRYTTLSDAVEPPPEGTEISRRTIEIEAVPLSPDIPPDSARIEIVQKAPWIIAGLKRKMETAGAAAGKAVGKDWFSTQAGLGGRPVGPVALSRLFGLELDPVRSRDLSDLFGAFKMYLTVQVRDGSSIFCPADEEGASQQAKHQGKSFGKLGKVRSYRYGHFLETMRKAFISGCDAILREIDSPMKLKVLLARETKYANVENGDWEYLPIAIDGQRWAFRMARTYRNFIIMGEMQFCEQYGATRISDPSVPDDLPSAVFHPGHGECPAAPAPPADVALPSQEGHYDNAFA